MSQKRNSIGKFGSTHRVRTVVGAERLESRSLLAGLINLPDTLLHPTAESIDSTPAQVWQTEAAVATAVRPQPDVTLKDQSTDTDGNEPAPPITEPLPTEQDKDKNEDGKKDEPGNQGEGVGTAADAGTAPTLSEGEKSPSESDRKRGFLTIVAAPPTRTERLTSLSPTVGFESRSLSRSAFRYFVESSVRNQRDSFNLASAPLASDSVRDTFVALVLLDQPSGEFDELTENQHATDRAADNDHHTPFGTKHSPSEKPIAQSEAESVEKAKVAIANAADIVREADATVAMALSRDDRNVENVDTVMRETFGNSSAAIDISTRSTPNPVSSLYQRWHLGLFGLVSMILSFRTRRVGADDSVQVHYEFAAERQPMQRAKRWKRRRIRPTVRHDTTERIANHMRVARRIPIAGMQNR